MIEKTHQNLSQKIGDTVRKAADNFLKQSAKGKAVGETAVKRGFKRKIAGDKK